MVGIYVITNTVNGKQYVGRTQIGYIYRFNQHLKAYDQGLRYYLACAIHKWGADSFKVDLLAQVEDDSWEFWERFYIKKLHTRYTEGGYNVTAGGTDNPMDDPSVKSKHNKICKGEYFRNLQRALQTGRKHSEETKELCRKNTLSNLDVCLAGFRKYNDSRKIKVGMIDNNVIIKVFDSLSDAARYVCNLSDKYTYSTSYCSFIKAHADKFNKNGKRSKFLGYSWTLNV